MTKKFAIQFIIVIMMTILLVAVVLSVFQTNVLEMTTNYIFTQYEASVKLASDFFVDNFEESNTFYSKIPLYGFEEILVVNAESGSVTFSSGGDIIGALVSKLSEEDKVKFDKGNSFNCKMVLNGLNYQVFFGDKEPNLTLQVVGVVKYSGISATADNFVNTFLLFSVTVFVVAEIGAMLLFVFYKRRNDAVGNVAPLNNYILDCDKRGNIRRANKDFRKRFNTTEVATHIVGDKITLAQSVEAGKHFIIWLQDITTQKAVYLDTIAVWSHTGYKLICADATEEQEHINALLESEQHDSVTGLYNISIFDKDWEKIKAKNTGMKCAICYIRMEQYDLFEASSGLIGADKIVETYARVASNVLGQYGKLYIANKKDFILFVSNEQLRTKFLTDLMELTTKLLDTFAIDGRLYRPESRIGVILTDNCNDSITSEKILYIAKKALKIAYKNTINNLYVLRAPQFNNEMIDFSRESAVTTMISNNELEVYFQPQVNIKTNKIYGFEALTRIVGASAGEITIEELINNAHQYGGILELGEFVLHKAMQFAKSIQEYDIHISVNVSPLQIMQKGFAHSVLNMIKKYQVNPRNISIEIVENAALYNNGELFKKIQTLREGGVSVHMDDFGIAYSSLLRLKTLPIDTIKIDKSFVDDILTDAISASLVKNIIMIARDLKLECICEGVESKEQCKMVEKLGCYIIQGYLYSKAIDAEHAKELLKEKNANV